MKGHMPKLVITSLWGPWCLQGKVGLSCAFARLGHNNQSPNFPCVSTWLADGLAPPSMAIVCPFRGLGRTRRAQITEEPSA